eukprot:TRINITY_DN2140_c0_g1_i1.p1 TRINITY_DN2140_c0_g1~~TRINITY_DN2140_c0_g1_i1.p1  ORF type:complete len:373 (+),score=149.00 TRINITY_DN2140_c0_g1_i1:152-1270(+)
MADKKKLPPIDKKTETTFKTIETLRGSSGVFQEFIKAASAYQKTALKLAEDGKKLADALQKIAQLQQGIDLGDGIQKLSDALRSVEGKRESLCKAMQEDLINALSKGAKPEELELAQFEGDYKKARTDIRTQIDKLEQNSKKAGKKGPEALKQAIASLNDKIKEADQIKADKLRSVLLLERKKYCNFLSQWGPVVMAEVDLTNEEGKFKENEQYWRTLASSSAQLPNVSEELIKAQPERTFVALASSQSEGGYSSYNDDYNYDDYNSGGSASQYGSVQTSSSWSSGGGGSSYGNNSSSYGGNNYSGGGGYGAGGGLGSATALYDFAGEQPGDLPFYTGEVINVTVEDDGSGWLTGELNGRTGIFPSSYVQRS